MSCDASYHEQNHTENQKSSPINLTLIINAYVHNAGQFWNPFFLKMEILWNF